jgi:MFS transporter, MHS family, citrate/tricarballylate:H+ symporter
LKLPESESLIVTLFVVVTNFMRLPIGGAISDRIGRQPLSMSILAFVTACPMSWFAADPTFAKMIAIGLLFSIYFGTYDGAPDLSEVVPTHARASGFSLAHSLATATT